MDPDQFILNSKLLCLVNDLLFEPTFFSKNAVFCSEKCDIIKPMTVTQWYFSIAAVLRHNHFSPIKPLTISKQLFKNIPPKRVLVLRAPEKQIWQVVQHLLVEKTVLKRQKTMN